MTERVPDDVMAAAREAVEAMPARAPFKSDVEIAISRAILAERERCAKIAEYYPSAAQRRSTGERIAQSIRGES